MRFHAPMKKKSARKSKSKRAAPKRRARRKVSAASSSKRVVRFWALALFGVFALCGFNFFKKKEAPAPEKDDRDLITQIQIYLDSQNFGPGKIDGALGEFTHKAVRYFNQARGAKPEELDNWYQVIKEAKRMVPQPFSEYKIHQDDFKFINPKLPSEPAEQEKLKFLAYRNAGEFVAERFHTDTRFLWRLNPKMKSLESLRAGDVLVVPNVEPFPIEDVPKHRKFGEEERLSARKVVIDTGEKMASFFEGDDLLAAFPITPGQKKFIPYGEWKIVNMVTTPYFRWDDKMLKEGKRGDDAYNLPPGPNNPVGIFWAGISKSGIGLHGTRDPGTIGRSRSAGCIRFANWDAIRLSTLVRPGAKVVVK